MADERIDVTVNGERRAFAPGTTVATVVADLAGGRGDVAVAVNEAVVPRQAWSRTPLAQSDRIELLTAVQGG